MFVSDIFKNFTDALPNQRGQSRVKEANMPLPRTSFGSDTKRRSPLYPVAEEDDESDNDDILSLLENKTKPTTRPKSASLAEPKRHAKTNSDITFSSNKQFDSSVIMDQLKGLSNDVQSILDKQQQLSANQSDVDAKLVEQSGALTNFQSSIISGISASQSEVAALCQGIAQLKNWLESNNNNHDDDNLTDSIKLLMRSVAKHNENLTNLTTSFKNALKAQTSSSVEQKESLDSLKRESIENRSLLEEMWAKFEKDAQLLRKEQEALLAEKEKISQDRIRFEQEEALLEQRKVSFFPCLLSLLCVSLFSLTLMILSFLL